MCIQIRKLFFPKKIQIMNTQNQSNIAFQRRADLTFQKRFLICYLVVYQNRHGLITDLARKYNVSRKFIYNLRDNFIENSENYVQKAQFIDKQKINKHSLDFIFKLRLQGKCSIQSISQILKSENEPNASVGFISETLNRAGSQIGNNLDINTDKPLQFVFCCDEIFAKDKPILITVDPLSLTILRIELCENHKSLSWENFWTSLISQGYIPLYITKDEGISMKKAKEIVFQHVNNQSDTFHAVSHRLGLLRINLEEAAFKAIKFEYECKQLLDKVKRESTITKRKNIYKESQIATLQAIELYELFAWLYDCLLSCFQNFDNAGNLKNSQQTIEDFDVALELFKLLNNNKINEQLKRIENCKKDLFYFTKIAKNIVVGLSQIIDNDILKELCLAWQLNQNMIKLKHKPELKHKMERRQNYILKDVKELLENEYEIIKNQVYESLNHIIQSSASVECVNSLLRPYLNTCKNQPSQELLNLFMFYHNHKRFLAGKRKGKTPWEIATGKKQEKEWLELLLEKIKL
jgi:hypothetical protein